MKGILGVILAVVVGGLLGFFGVFASVFSDGALSERLIAIGVILVIYSILGWVSGFLSPRFSWKWGLALGLPGALLLLVYGFKEKSIFIYALVYMILILFCSCLSAFLGAALKRKRKKI